MCVGPGPVTGVVVTRWGGLGRTGLFHGLGNTV